MKYLATFILLVPFSLSAQAFLITPIAGVQEEDWIIVNYVDWDTIGFLDHNCGSKSYDGHQGTDYTIKSFKHMDEGVNVLAAASGIVTFIKDGEFDRETEGDITKGLGNYIAIRHDNSYYSYYGHLKKNSILVSPGEDVEAGEIIAQVGSSGNSTDPHLHFELWFDSLFVVDPFTGPCGNQSSLFIESPDYVDDFGIIEHGLHHKNNLAINDLRERIETTECCPYQFQQNSDTVINFWSHMYGLEEGRALKLIWYTPDDDEWFSFDITLDRDYWYYYYWSFINHQNLTPGRWRVELFYDGEQVITEEFDVFFSTSTNSHSQKKRCFEFNSLNSTNLISSLDSENFKLFDLYGRQINVHSGKLTPGYYTLQKSSDTSAKCIQKILVTD